MAGIRVAHTSAASTQVKHPGPWNLFTEPRHSSQQPCSTSPCPRPQVDSWLCFETSPSTCWKLQTHRTHSKTVQWRGRNRGPKDPKEGKTLVKTEMSEEIEMRSQYWWPQNRTREQGNSEPWQRWACYAFSPNLSYTDCSCSPWGLCRILRPQLSLIRS